MQGSQSQEQVFAAATSDSQPVATTTVDVAREPGFLLRRMLAGADALAVFAAIVLAMSLVDPGRATLGRVWVGLIAILPAIMLFKLYGLYDRDAKRVSHSTLDDVPHLFHALVLGTLGVWLLFKVVTPDARLILAETIAFGALAFVAVLAGRAGVRKVAASLMRPERVLLLGGGSMAAVLVRKLRTHREYALDPIGYVDAGPGESVGWFPPPYLGTIDELDKVCRESGVERVLAVPGALEHEDLADVVRRMRTLKVRVSLVPDLVDVLGPSVEIDDIEGITVLGINPPSLSRSSRALKRAMDLVVASAVLTVLLPMLSTVALVVRLGSRGPIIYSQERVGRDGRRFRIYKFRTMVADAEQRGKELERDSRHPVWLLLDVDPRITRIGRWLRRTSVDELPQLYNVLRGDMSLVGPRPMLPAMHDHITGWGAGRLDLTPGLTGLWQVLGRTAIPFEEMVKLDYLYAANWSLWYDVRLLIRTLPAIISGRGAN
jgi:exopolysaccharide biosynthesis polyprenyl glycosylphosphotransferase